MQSMEICICNESTCEIAGNYVFNFENDKLAMLWNAVSPMCNQISWSISGLLLLNGYNIPTLQNDFAALVNIYRCDSGAYREK